MTRWRQAGFAEVVQSRGSGSSGLPQSEWTPQGQYPVIGQGAEQIEGWTDRADLVITPKPAIVLYGGHTRRAKFVDRPFVPGPNIKILEPAAELDAAFLYRYLEQLRIESRGYADHFPEVRRCRVPIPPLNEQQRIAEILDKVDALRAKRRAALIQLDTLTQSIFLDMFGDSMDNEDLLGRHTTRVTKGTTPTTLGYPFTDSGIPLLRVQNLRGDQIDFTEDVLYVSRETNRALSRSQIRPGDVLTTIAGTIGRTVVVPANAPDANCNQAVAIITPRESLSSLYLCYWLRSTAALRQMSQGQVTATISNLSLKQIKSLKICVPSIVEQRGFADRVEAVQRTKVAHQSAVIKLNALFASLQRRAFRGEL